ncbi:MAG: hypothetical protein U5L96_18830 [Owenweeksia sp.]|nr:hypothetical protein [Owenweeksia sp.]
MKRHKYYLKNTSRETLKSQLLQTCQQAEYGAFLDSNHHPGPYNRYEWIAAWDGQKVLCCHGQCFEKLRQFRQQNPDWLFGHISYDLKNDLEQLSTSHADDLAWPPLSFFVPGTVVYQKRGSYM